LSDEDARAYLDWPPSVNHYYAVVKGRKILSARGRRYKREQGVLLRLQGVPAGQAGRIHLEIQAAPPDKRKRDLDNVLKPILDSLVDYGALVDDSAIDFLSIQRLAPQPPGVIEVLIRRIHGR
jgi:crossover junction endodeoxyribonuclease RusA